MSDVEINKVHKQAEHLSRQQFDLTVNGQAENAGVRKVNAADGNLDNQQDSKEKKKDMSWELLQLIQDFKNDVGDMLDRLKEIREEMDKVGNRINKGKAALESGSMDAITFQLMSEHNYSQEKIDGMSDDQKTEALENHIEEDKLTYDQLKNEYIKVDQALQDKLNSDTFQMLSKEDQERLKREYETASQAEIVRIDAKAGHLDVENAKADAREVTGWDSSVLSKATDSMALSEGEEFEAEFEDFSAFDEFSSSSFADTLDDGNQFAASAGSITQSFNQAGGMTTMTSDVDLTGELKQSEDATYSGQSMTKGMKL
ncbi:MULTISPECIES: hypothetical protein [Roseivirga]|uniref:Uncharacterized protein n=1 Tax=Roseivirga spongicola TaxID=333140 RepID=A0A150XFL4_9BACT|nr:MULTISPECIES: hypothetical protein [Roseivirga]KYG77519.1 hypothetical protein AWW68_01745 [Roseivirga spongicola]MBO6661681.1 hypothetical protein [Roseivirga sp.]MBO6908334.1 hypothetical protein [Roseivirga sp.]WPZ11230.1 hypothetical protein T7867_03830 [Roseivirga spongicola]